MRTSQRLLFLLVFFLSIPAAHAQQDPRFFASGGPELVKYLGSNDGGLGASGQLGVQFPSGLTASVSGRVTSNMEFFGPSSESIMLGTEAGYQWLPLRSARVTPHFSLSGGPSIVWGRAGQRDDGTQNTFTSLGLLGRATLGATFFNAVTLSVGVVGDANSELSSVGATASVGLRLPIRTQ